MTNKTRTLLPLVILLGALTGAAGAGPAGSDAAEHPSDDTLFIMRSQHTSRVVTPKDTVVVLTNESVRDFLDTAQQPRLSGRQRGYGGCIGPTFGVVMLDMRPVKEVLRQAPAEYAGVVSAIEGNYEPMSVYGGRLYGGIGNGTRIGLEGRGGTRSFAAPSNDSAAARIKYGYGGFLVEKALVAGDFNFLLGGVIGAGGMRVDLITADPFTSMAGDTGNAVKGSAGTAFWLLQVHGGITWSILPWLHLGLEGFAPMHFSSGGFKSSRELPLTNQFFTVNPGVNLRIALGNIG